MTVVYGTSGSNGRSLSRSLLAAAVKDLWGWEEVPPLERSPRGKPEFSGKPGHWLSLSHSKGYALCALSDEGPVGVDIEVVRPHRKNLPRYAMTAEEFSAFDGTWESFCRVWVLKESFCKMTDSPLFPPRKVSTPPNCPHKIWTGEGWQAAVCCTALPHPEIIWL